MSRFGGMFNVFLWVMCLVFANIVMWVLSLAGVL